MPSNQDDETLHVVDSDETLDASWVIDEITDSLSDIGEWISAAQDHERTALAVWDGQSEDGKKWRQNYGKKVFPFEGAADSRVHLSCAAVDELTMLEMLAVDSAKVQVIAMEANDAASSKKVETLMKYETRQRMRGELWRERNFARQVKHTFGHAVMHIGWELRMGTARASITQDDLVKLQTSNALAQARAMAAQEGAQPDESGEVLTPEMQMQIADMAVLQVEEMLAAADPTPVVNLIRQLHPLLSPQRARRVVRELGKADRVEFAAPYRKPGKPSVRAYLPGIDVFYPWWTCPVDRAPWVARIDSYSEPEVRAKPKTDGWDQKAVDALIAMGPKQVIDTGVIMQAMGSTAQRIFNEPAKQSFAQRLAGKERQSYEVLHVTVNTVDEEGYPAVQEIILHPGLCGKSQRDKGQEYILKNQLVDYYFDGGCYVDMRREYKARPLFESRGVPEMVGTHQWLLKSNRDASMDRTSFATMPIVKVNARRAGGGARWDYEPGSKLPLGQGDEADYMRPPPLDQGTILDANEIRRDVANLLGLHHAEVPQAKVMMHQQWVVTCALLEEREILLRILAMDQQFMEPLFVSRVLGSGPLPFQVTREEIAGSFDFVLEFDVKSLDMEYLQKRWSALKDAFSIPGVAGQVPTVPVVSWLMNNIDPGLADLVTGGMKERNLEQVEAEKAAIAMMLTGIEPSITEDMDAAVRLQTDQEQMQMNPNVAAAYAAGGSFTQMMNARLEAFQFQIQQRTENAQTGRTGFKPVMGGEA
jgi:hypothetical protein